MYSAQKKKRDRYVQVKSDMQKKWATRDAPTWNHSSILGIGKIIMN